jgi:hypothetical protein
MTAEAQANAAKKQQNWRGWYNEQVGLHRRQQAYAELCSIGS